MEVSIHFLVACRHLSLLVAFVVVEFNALFLAFLLETMSFVYGLLI